MSTLPILLPVDIWTVSKFCLLWMIPPWTLSNLPFSEYVFICSILDHRVCACLTVSVRRIFKAVVLTCKQPDVCRFSNCNTHTCEWERYFFSLGQVSFQTHLRIIYIIPTARCFELQEKDKVERKESWMLGCVPVSSALWGWRRRCLSLEPAMNEAKERGQRLPELWRASMMSQIVLLWRTASNALIPRCWILRIPCLGKCNKMKTWGKL